MTSFFVFAIGALIVALRVQLEALRIERARAASAELGRAKLNDLLIVERKTNSELAFELARAKGRS